MEKHRCRLVAVEDWKKCGIIMKVESQYLLDDNNVLHENALYILNIRKFVLLVTSIICVAALGHAIIARCMSAVQTLLMRVSVQRQLWKWLRKQLKK